MTTSDVTTAIVVDQTTNEAFDVINNPQDWWSGEIKGDTKKITMSLPIDIKNCIFQSKK